MTGIERVELEMRTLATFWIRDWVKSRILPVRPQSEEEVDRLIVILTAFIVDHMEFGPITIQERSCRA